MRVAVAYAVAVFVVVYVADLTVEPLGLPEWTSRLMFFLSLVGFPVAVGLAWAFDVTPEGIRTDEWDAQAHAMGKWVVAASVAVAAALAVWHFLGG